MSLRAIWRAVALSFMVSAGAHSAQADTVHIPINQARAVAVQALANNNPDLAMQIALGLIQKNPKDGFAYFIIANAQKALNNPALGRQAAGYAFRYAQTPVQKFEASQLAARLSNDAKHYTRAQLWLRRSVRFAPSPQHLEIIKRDYAILRKLNPWDFRLRFSVSPSNNVNNGADSPYNIIDGVPAVGLLSGTALALSGTTANADLSLSYRLSRTKRSETTLSGRLIVQRIWLTSAAKAIAPTAQNRDFGSTTAEVALRHSVLTADAKGLGTASLTLGQSWYGAKHQHDFARVDLSYEQGLSSRTGIFGAASGEKRTSTRGAAFDATLFTVKAGMAHTLSNGDKLAFTLAVSKNETPQANGRYNRQVGYVSYSFEKPLGPAKVALVLGSSQLTYNTYNVGIIAVPGGRRDKSTFAIAYFTFETVGYAGFSPQISLRMAKTQSNVSRFDTDEFSVSIGVASNF